MKYYKNSNQLEVGDKLQGYLNQFKTIEDFRVEEPEITDAIAKDNNNKPNLKKKAINFSDGEAANQNNNNNIDGKVVAVDAKVRDV